MYNFIPENLEWCTNHYVPPVKKFISCGDFGKCDGMDGACWWCMEMTPYQWEMCSDEAHKTSLMKTGKSEEEAISYIKEYKKKSPSKNTIIYLYELMQRSKEISK